MADSQLKTVLEGDAAKLFQEFQKVIAKATELEGGYDKVHRASKKAGDQAAKSFGQQAAGELQSYLTKTLSIATAISGVAQAMRDVKQAS